MPRIDTLLNKLKDAKFYSTLDLCSGYWQVPMSPESIEKTAISTHMGLFEFLVLPFGLCNAPSGFSRMMKKILGATSNVLVYLDDIIIYSADFDSHLKHLDTVLDRLMSFDLICKLKKCSFAYNKIKFLGHFISEDGIQPDPTKIFAIQNFKIPEKPKDVRSFLGFSGYYRRFIKNYSIIAKPLFELTGNVGDFKWEAEQQDAFDKLKQSLTDDSIIKTFDTNRPTFLTTDASKQGLGAILEQKIGDKTYVIEYASRTLRPNEVNFGSSELECLALIWACQHFRHYLLGIHFTVLTDHHSLCWLKNLNNPSGRLSRWAIQLSEFNFDIVYKKGKLNCNADCLSRYPQDVPVLSIDVVNITQEKLIASQKVDSFWKGIRESLDSNPFGKYILVQDLLCYRLRTPYGNKYVPCVPREFVQDIMFLCHDVNEAGHLGRNRMMDKIKDRFYWPGMVRDISNYVLSCPKCQATRENNAKPTSEMVPIPPTDIFYQIGMDIIGPIHESKRGNKYILTFVDFATRYADAVALKTITSADVIQALLERIFLRYGAPGIITSDRGVQFTSKTTQDLVKKLSSKPQFTTAYHPQANGLVERFNKTIVSMLRKFVAVNQTDWDVYIPYVLWAYNTTYQASTKTSPYRLVFGREPVLPIDNLFDGIRIANTPYVRAMAKHIDIIRRNARLELIKEQEKQRQAYNAKHKLIRRIAVGDWVMLKRNAKKVGLSEKLLPKFTGPFKVIKVVGRVNYLIDFGTKTDYVHVDNLKLYNLRPNALEEERVRAARKRYGEFTRDSDFVEVGEDAERPDTGMAETDVSDLSYSSDLRDNSDVAGTSEDVHRAREAHRARDARGVRGTQLAPDSIAFRTRNALRSSSSPAVRSGLFESSDANDQGLGSKTSMGSESRASNRTENWSDTRNWSDFTQSSQIDPLTARARRAAARDTIRKHERSQSLTGPISYFEDDIIDTGLTKHENIGQKSYVIKSMEDLRPEQYDDVILEELDERGIPKLRVDRYYRYPMQTWSLLEESDPNGMIVNDLTKTELRNVYTNPLNQTNTHTQIPNVNQDITQENTPTQENTQTEFNEFCSNHPTRIRNPSDNDGDHSFQPSETNEDSFRNDYRTSSTPFKPVRIDYIPRLHESVMNSTRESPQNRTFNPDSTMYSNQPLRVRLSDEAAAQVIEEARRRKPSPERPALQTVRFNDEVQQIPNPIEEQQNVETPRKRKPRATQLEMLLRNQHERTHARPRRDQSPESPMNLKRTRNQPRPNYRE